MLFSCPSRVCDIFTHLLVPGINNLYILGVVVYKTDISGLFVLFRHKTIAELNS